MMIIILIHLGQVHTTILNPIGLSRHAGLLLFLFLLLFSFWWWCGRSRVLCRLSHRLFGFIHGLKRIGLKGYFVGLRGNFLAFRHGLARHDRHCLCLAARNARFLVICVCECERCATSGCFSRLRRLFIYHCRWLQALLVSRPASYPGVSSFAVGCTTSCGGALTSSVWGGCSSCVWGAWMSLGSGGCTTACATPEPSGAADGNHDLSACLRLGSWQRVSSASRERKHRASTVRRCMRR